uniref:Uncharacterized protein LOC100175283 n=1 Tax=Phallusia mammillata TaxID=59560 RepID=A0A6F9DFP1_9ASCI|nr:uncharacterized protein LOC100175283 [Phallusia mammillata]
MRQEAAKSMKLTGHVHPKLLGSVDERSEANRSTSNQQQHQNRTKSVTLNSLPMKSSSPITTVDIRPSVPKSSVPVSGLNLTDLDENYNVINGPNPPSPVSPIRMEEIFELANYAPLGTGTKFGVPANTPKTPKVPPTSSKLSSSDARSLLQDDRLPSSYENRSRAGNFRHGSKSASTLPRSNGSSPRNYPMQIASDLPQHPPNRGFHGSPLTGRTQTGKAGQSRFGSTTKSFKTATPVGLTGVDNINKLVEFPTRTGFIQISHSLHIPPQRPSSGKAEKRNKIYDSYMRELTSRTERRNKYKGLHSGKTNGVVVKSLGGTSGKIFPDHQGGIKPQTAPAGGGSTKSKPNYNSFSAHAGRRSGLAIAGEISAPPVHQAKSNGGSVHLGLHGDPVRLNLDKNIHNIYRDLGILKKPGNGSGATSPQQSNIMTYEEVQVVNNGAKRNVKSAGRRSDGSRSRAHSAISGERIADSASLHSVVTIPTAANSTHDYDDADLNDTDVDSVKQEEIKEQNADTGDIPLTNGQQGQSELLQTTNDKEQRASSAKKSNDMADFGTQCNPAEMEPKDEIAPSMATNGDNNTAVDTTHETDPPQSENIQNRMELDTGAVNMIDIHSDANERLPENPIHEIQPPSSPPQDVAENQNLSKSVLQTDKPDDGLVTFENDPDEKSKQSSENVEDTENGAPLPIADRRSLSESHLDKIGTEDDTDDAGGKIVEEDVDVRGVTKVTVNIPPAVK